jgi:hypothetical protein
MTLEVTSALPHWHFWVMDIPVIRYISLAEALLFRPTGPTAKLVLEKLDFNVNESSLPLRPQCLDVMFLYLYYISM